MTAPRTQYLTLDELKATLVPVPVVGLSRWNMAIARLVNRRRRGK